MIYCSFTVFIGFLNISLVLSQTATKCDIKNVKNINLLDFSKAIIPPLDGFRRKGEDGKILVIGGSTEYTGAPYFAAISALKVGADLVYVITTESAAPVIKSYSPDLIVYPFLHSRFLSKINNLLPKMDIIIIGSGLGREESTLNLIFEIMQTCKNLKKPLVIDADGLYAISENILFLKNYPLPGVILTPNHHEAERLMNAVPSNFSNWYEYWGNSVSILVKGKEDKYHSTSRSFPFQNWETSELGSGRRVGGQGDILAGALGTFYNWALKYFNECDNIPSGNLAQSISAYAAVKLTRTCNSKGFLINGRSMTASDMITQIHHTFHELFEY